MTRTIAVAALAALTLAACSKKADDAAPASGADAPAASAPVSAATPKPTPGKWRLTSTMEGMPAGMPSLPPTEICLKAEDLTDDGAWATGGKKPANCSQMTQAVTGGAVTVHAVCSEQGITTTMDIRASGDFTRRYTTETTMSMSPAAPGAPNPMKITVVSERVGDC